MDTILSASFLTALFASGVRQSIPLIYGSVGDAVSERAGVMGISLEGEMLFGAFFSYLVALRTGSLWIGVLAGAAAGMLSSLIVAVWSVWLRQDQSIIGIMFNILAVGFTNFLNRMIFGTSNANITIETFQPIAIPGLSRVPVLGEIFFNQNILTYLSVVLAASGSCERPSWACSSPPWGRIPRRPRPPASRSTASAWRPICSAASWLASPERP